MRSSSAVLPSVAAVLLLLLACLMTTPITNTVDALGASNIFGVFLKRRRNLMIVQERREAQATLKGFAGPHGSPFTGDEAREMAAADGRTKKNKNDRSPLISPVAKWFREKSNS